MTEKESIENLKQEEALQTAYVNLIEAKTRYNEAMDEYTRLQNEYTNTDSPVQKPKVMGTPKKSPIDNMWCSKVTIV